jgi:hypothetical protein
MWHQFFGIFALICCQLRVMGKLSTMHAPFLALADMG